MEKQNKQNSFWKEFFSIKMIVINAMVASLYAVLTYLGGFLGLSYGFMQFRFSEFLMLLAFFNPSYSFGLTLGCLIANLMSTAGIYDVVFGTLATLISCLLMVGFSKLWKNLFFNGLIPCLINAIMVPFIIYLACLNTPDEMTLDFALYFTMFGWVFLGEFLSINVFGYVIMMPLAKKYKGFYPLINARSNLDFKW